MYTAKDRGRARGRDLRGTETATARPTVSLRAMPSDSPAFVPPPYPHDRLGPIRATAARGARRHRRPLGRHARRPDARGRARRPGDSRARRHRLPGHDRQPRLPRGRGWAGSSAASGARVTADDVIACIGTKELVASLPRMLSLRDPSRDTVLYPAVAYPTYEMGALLAGLARGAGAGRRRVAPRPRPRRSPPTPTGRCCSGSTTRATPPARSPAPTGCSTRSTWARARGIIVASDECYAEFTYDADGAPAAPVTALAAGADGVLAVHSLSKRSNMAGLRAGFVAGDRDARRLPRRDAQARRADDAGAGAGRGGRRARRRRARPRAAGPLRAPARGGARPRSSARAGARRRPVHLLPVAARRRPARATAGRSPPSSPTTGLLVAPGDFYGAAGADHVRVALTLTDDRNVDAALDPASRLGPTPSVTTSGRRRSARSARWHEPREDRSPRSGRAATTSRR